MSDSLGLVSHTSSNSTVQSETHNCPFGVVPFPNIHDPVMDLPIPLGHVVFKSRTPPGCQLCKGLLDEQQADSPVQTCSKDNGS